MRKYLLVTIAVGALFITGGIAIVQSQHAARLEQAMEEIYLSALHQTAEEMNTLSLAIEKALLTTDPALSATLLNSISRSADHVQQSMALLPVSHQAMLPTLHFVHQLTDYTSGLLPQVVEQRSLSAQAQGQLRQQLALCTQLCGQLSLINSAADLETLTLDGINLAEAPAAPVAKGLPAGEITQEEAIDIARSFVGDDRVIRLQTAPGTSGSLAAYGVTVTTADVQLNLEITRQGGKVLWMVPETASFAVTQSIESCRTAAQAFVELHGFDPMQAVHHQVYDGLCVISFVPLQQDILLYPDLIRVQVRMDTAQVVGLEAHNYWLNHTQRILPAPGIQPDTLRQRLTDKAEVTGWQLCLIPHEGEEVLCYEFTLVHDGESYLIYIDAQNGHEIELLKTIHLENGMLTA